jgi:hypothetical protein
VHAHHFIFLLTPEVHFVTHSLTHTITLMANNASQSTTHDVETMTTTGRTDGRTLDDSLSFMYVYIVGSRARRAKFKDDP